MRNRILVATVLAVLFINSAVFAAENDKAQVVADDSKKAAADVAKDGVWVGVIEDIQHLKDADSFKLTDGAQFAREMTGLFMESTIGYMAFLFASDHITYRDPQFFLITLKQTNNSIEKFVIHERLQWNIGDRIEITKNGNSVSVKTLELGELSRYAAEREAAQNK